MPKRRVVPHHLHEELVEVILLGLPVKSLTRFRGVSKRFDAIISEPRFARLQYETACRNPFDNNRYEIFVLDNDLRCLHGEALSKTVVFNNRFESVNAGIEFDSFGATTVSSCRGLICFAINSWLFHPPHVFLWNSLNRRYYQVPELRFNSTVLPLYSGMGFGYDYFADDYKIVVPFRPKLDDGTLIQVEVFSLRNRNWRTIVAENNRGQFYFPLTRSGIYFKGHICWLESCDVQKRKIICFDVAKERFCLMDSPSHNIHQVNLMEMGVIGGCLCVCIGEEGKGVAMWDMKDFDDDRSWTRIAFIPCSILPSYKCCLMPLFVLDNGEILMFCPFNGDLSIYNLKKNNSRTIFHSAKEEVKVITHLESLLSYL